MKKLLSIFIIAALLLSLSALAVSAESHKGFYIELDPFVVGSETYGFKNPDGWEEVYAYAYNDVPNWFDATENAPYPGEKATYKYVEGYGYIYTYSFASGAFKYVTFNDGKGNAPIADAWKEKIFEASHIDDVSYSDYYYKELYFHNLTGNPEPDYILVRLVSNVVTPMPVADSLGKDYIVRGTSAYFPFDYGYGIYIPSEDRALGIEEAFEEGVEGIEDSLPYITDKELVGDVNKDQTLNISDATTIQKQLAGLLEIKNDAVEAYGSPVGSISDFDRDGKCTIKDATAIQKKLAGLPPYEDDEPLMPEDERFIKFTVSDEFRIEHSPSDDTEYYVPVTSRSDAEAFLAAISGGFYTAPALDEKYDDDFFSENTLIFTTSFVGGSCCSQRISDVSVFGNTLYVYRTIFKVVPATPDMNYRCAVIEVSNKDISGVVNFESITEHLTATTCV